MTTNRHQIKSYFDDDEKARLDALCTQMRLSRSELLRRLVMGRPLPSPADFAAWESVRDLLKVNADQARLGNLLKLAIDEAGDDGLSGRLEALRAEIAETQRELKAGAGEIRRLVQPARA